ncbi:MAG: hypothetical protein HRU09_20525 [Oligoflexales bacterium]|nr:hypothetical protein [Oligoflexales bacterium]
MDYKIKELNYENSLGKVTLTDIMIDMDQDQIDLFEKGTNIEDLDYGLNGLDIEKAEREIAFQFYKDKYQDILSGVYEVNKDEIFAIQNYLGLNKLQFAKILGLDRGSLANIYKRNSCSHPVQILIIERMGMELVRKGSAKALYNNMCKLQNVEEKLSKPSQETSEKIAHIRFGNHVA